jgi:hypothetical protein
MLVGFGESLDRLRGAAGYTQMELAEEVCVSQHNVAHYDFPSQYILFSRVLFSKITFSDSLIPLKLPISTLKDQIRKTTFCSLP